MNIRKLVLPLFLLSGSMPIQNATKIANPVVCRDSVQTFVSKNITTTLANDSLFSKMAKDTFSLEFSDAEKIINYNKLLKKYNKPTDNYIIVNKKKCIATVYSPEGDTLYTTEVALGRNIGDKRSGGYKVKGAKLRAYTTPGEFEISREGARNEHDMKLYNNRVMAISGDHTLEEYKKTQTLALHRVPVSKMGLLREKVLKNKTLNDNRVSFGCVNFLEESYDKMRALIRGIKTKVYILPEEKGNSLFLEKQSDGTYKFVQSKYRTEEMENLTK